MRILLLSCFFIAVNSYAYDEDVSIDDFAKGIELLTEGQAAIYKLALPEDVYKNTIRKDLVDVRVFNQAREVVPHIIHGFDSQPIDINETITLPFFPIEEEVNSDGSGNLDVTVASDGKIIRFQSINAQSGTDIIAKYYLIDTSHIGYPIESIELDIEDNDKGYTKKIKLEYSQDLNYWSTLLTQATLTELGYGNHVLKNTRINLPDRKAKYLRLSWLDDVDDLRITGIKANLSRSHKAVQQNWSNAELINISNDPKSYEYDAGGLFYIRQFDIQLPEVNTLIDVTVKSRTDDKTKWITQYNGVFYRLNMNDTEITGSPVAIRPVKHRYWRVELKSTEGMGQASPVFKYAWSNNELYFLARGQGPFILVYGNANMDDGYIPPTSLKNIINQDKKTGMVAEAFIGQEMILKGDAAFVVKQVLPWQRIILWMVLVIGVFITAFMVYRLAKQIEVK